MSVESKKTNNSDLKFKPVVHKYIELANKQGINRTHYKELVEGVQKKYTCNLRV